MNPSKLNVDEIIETLLEVKERSNKRVDLAESKITLLCRTVREIFMTQPMLLEIAAPVKICGDTHGKFTIPTYLFQFSSFYVPVSHYFSHREGTQIFFAFSLSFCRL